MFSLWTLTHCTPYFLNRVRDTTSLIDSGGVVFHEESDSGTKNYKKLLKTTKDYQKQLLLHSGHYTQVVVVVSR